MTLTLTREQRADFFRGHPPTIKGPGKCPVAVGYVHALSPKLSFTVTAIRKPQRGGWSLDYTVSDRRDAPRLLRRVPPAHDFGKDKDDRVRPPTAGEIRDAAEDSAYARSQHDLVPEAGEAVDELSQRRYTEQAHLGQEQSAELEQARREHYDLAQRLMRVRRDAELRGIDISSPERVIERQLARLERRVYQGKAA